MFILPMYYAFTVSHFRKEKQLIINNVNVIFKANKFDFLKFLKNCNRHTATTLCLRKTIKF